MRRASALAAMLVAQDSAFGASAPAPAQSLPSLPSSGGALAQVALSLALVVALIFVLAWAARRLKLVQQPAAGVMRLVAEMPLGPRERLLLVQVGDRQVLLAVGAQGVSSLSVLDTPVRVDPVAAAPAAANPAPTAFADRLRQLVEPGARRS